MRKKIVAGNWKMNLTLEEAITLSKELIQAEMAASPKHVQLILCPPFPFLSGVLSTIDGSKGFALGAQNCATEASGAFTGEVAAKMLKSVGASYVILGHSERRAMYHESDEVIVKKLNQVLSNGLQPIFCCGETLAERESNKHFEIIKNQLSNALFQLNQTEFEKVIIAYEPVWAIGTGVTASAAQAQEMHQFIRSVLAEKFGTAAAENCSLLYGGSCNAANAKELFSNADVDGGLIGGASLKAKDFLTIANSFS